MTETFKPFDYQIPMIEHLLANDRAALFVSPGKGKTVVTLTALDTLATCGQFKAHGKQPTALQARWLNRLTDHSFLATSCDNVGKGQRLIDMITAPWQ